MTQTTPQPNKSKKWLIIIASTFALLITAFYIGSHIRSNITDGTENYTGFKQQLAKDSIAQLRLVDDINPVRVYEHLRVEAVRPTTPEEIQNDCSTSGYSTDPDDPRHYTVKISNRTLFGISVGVVELHGCHK